MESVMWCPHSETSGLWNSVVYALLGRMAWEQLYFSSLSCTLKYFLLGVAWTSQAGGGKSVLYLCPAPPFPTPTVSMVESAVAAAKENKAFSHLEGIPLWTSNVHSKQWSWNSFANKRSQEFFIVEKYQATYRQGLFPAHKHYTCFQTHFAVSRTSLCWDIAWSQWCNLN